MKTEYPSKNWTAWHDFMPGSPATLYVNGEVTVPTTGFFAELVPTNPQGINPAIYIFDLVVSPPEDGDIVHQTVTVLPVKYQEDTDKHYDSVEIRPEGMSVLVKPVH